jgi:hypothetical protein
MKTEYKYLNRAFRKATEYGLRNGIFKNKKEWKRQCRKMLGYFVVVNMPSMTQVDADAIIKEEMNYWEYYQ